jgi:hypothetical protein
LLLGFGKGTSIIPPKPSAPTKSQLAFAEHVASGIPSTTPGYHPEYQSLAYEEAYASGKMISPPSPFIPTPSKPLEGELKEAIVSAYTEYAESYKISTVEPTRTVKRAGHILVE